VGIIGTGFIGRAHASAWRNVAALFADVARPTLVVFCDADAHAAEAAAENFGFARAVADWRAADPAVHVVSITTPNALHREMAVAALQAGKHVWCEKPMALTRADAEAMAETAAQAAGQTLLGYNYARNPAIDHASRLIAAGTIGRVVHFRGCFDEDYSADATLPWSWRCRAADAGLGVLGDLMCHLISVSQTLVGPIARVLGDMETVHKTRPMPGTIPRHGALSRTTMSPAPWFGSRAAQPACWPPAGLPGGAKTDWLGRFMAPAERWPSTRSGSTSCNSS
jgi:predicted dehydrogenase